MRRVAQLIRTLRGRYRVGYVKRGYLYNKSFNTGNTRAVETLEELHDAYT